MGRFTDPHPLTCSFFTPPFCCLMFRQCEPPSTLFPPTFEWRRISSSIVAIPYFNVLPVQACLGLLFLFLFLPALCPFCLNFHQREARCFSAGKDGYFVSEGFSWQLPVATAAHNCPTRLQQGLFGASVVSFPYPALKTSHRAEFDFTVVFWCAFALAVTPSLAPACN